LLANPHGIAVSNQTISSFGSKSTWNSRLKANHFFLCQQIHMAWQQPHMPRIGTVVVAVQHGCSVLGQWQLSLTPPVGKSENRQKKGLELRKL